MALQETYNKLYSNRDEKFKRLWDVLSEEEQPLLTNLLLADRNLERFTAAHDVVRRFGVK